MGEIRIYTPEGSWTSVSDDPTLRAIDYFNEKWKCLECGFEGHVPGEVHLREGSLIGITKCPECGFEEEY